MKWDPIRKFRQTATLCLGTPASPFRASREWQVRAGRFCVPNLLFHGHQTLLSPRPTLLSPRPTLRPLGGLRAQNRHSSSQAQGTDILVLVHRRELQQIATQHQLDPWDMACERRRTGTSPRWLSIEQTAPYCAALKRVICGLTWLSHRPRRSNALSPATHLQRACCSFRGWHVRLGPVCQKGQRRSLRSHPQ